MRGKKAMKDELFVLVVAILAITAILVLYEPSYFIRDNLAKDALENQGNFTSTDWEEFLDGYQDEGRNQLVGMAAKKKVSSGKVISGILMIIVGVIMGIVSFIGVKTLVTEGASVNACDSAALTLGATGEICLALIGLVILLITTMVILIMEAMKLLKPDKVEDPVENKGNLTEQAETNQAGAESSDPPGPRTLNELERCGLYTIQSPQCDNTTENIGDIRMMGDPICNEFENGQIIFTVSCVNGHVREDTPEPIKESEGCPNGLEVGHINEGNVVDFTQNFDDVEGRNIFRLVDSTYTCIDTTQLILPSTNSTNSTNQTDVVDEGSLDSINTI